MRSPASSSSAGGSGPSSPYTPAPACTAYHPSVFTSSPGAGADVGVHPSASHPAASYDDIALGLYDAQSGMDYTSYASTWLAASPWAACASASAQGVEQGDFDLARVPGVGLDIAWGLGIGLGDAFPASSGGDAFPAGDSAHFAYEEMYAPDVQGDSASGGGEMAFEDVFSMEA